MKKYLSKIALLLTSLAVFTSCEEEIVNYNQGNLKALAGFSKTAGNLPVFETDPIVSMIQVGVSTTSNVDRTIVVESDATSTATSLQYTIDPASLVVPAGSYFGTIKITGNYAELPADRSKVVLVLKLISVGKEENQEAILSPKTTFTLPIGRSCHYDATLVTSTTFSASSTFTYQDQVINQSFVPVLTVAADSDENPSNNKVISVSTLWGEGIYGPTDVCAGQIIVNDDFTLTITGSSTNFGGAEGVYDTCENVFRYKIRAILDKSDRTQDLVIDVTFSPDN